MRSHGPTRSSSASRRPARDRGCGKSVAGRPAATGCSRRPPTRLRRSAHNADDDREQPLSVPQLPARLRSGVPRLPPGRRAGTTLEIPLSSQGQVLGWSVPDEVLVLLDVPGAGPCCGPAAYTLSLRPSRRESAAHADADRRAAELRRQPLPAGIRDDWRTPRLDPCGRRPRPVAPPSAGRPGAARRPCRVGSDQGGLAGPAHSPTGASASQLHQSRYRPSDLGATGRGQARGPGTSQCPDVAFARRCL